MSELRQDATTGAWVLLAPARGKRPRHMSAAAADTREPSDHDASCPFCPGNERLLPAIIAELPRRDGKGWQVRVVPNKYPAVRPCAPAEPAPSARARRACGHHEVIIETPSHRAHIGSPQGDARAVLEAYRLRSLALAAAPGIACVLPFRNYGGRAGASIVHPHSQIIALDAEFPRFAAIAQWARAQHAARGICPTCEMLERELEAGTRIVAVTAHHVALVPYAAASPFETWIVPRAHQPAFAQSSAPQLDDLAPALENVLRRLERALDDPPYNYVIESPGRSDDDAPWLHWRLRIVPAVGRPGGFEIGSGLPINTSCPEDDAARMRQSFAT